MRRLILLASILFVSAPAHAEWWEARTDHFIIYSQDGESKTRQFAVNLERYDNALRSLQSIDMKPLSDWQKVTIYRLGDFDTMGRLGHTSGIGGFYQPALLPVEFTPVRTENRLGSITAKMRDTRNDIGGYSIVQADSQEAAAKIFADSPHLSMPGASAEVMEIMAMP